MDEPGFISTRTDAASYADMALASILQGVRLSTRQQGYVREMVQSAFEDGELQGQFRALWILTIAERRAASSEARSLIRACMRLLAPDMPIDE